jgi:hypothetical protein
MTRRVRFNRTRKAGPAAPAVTCFPLFRRQGRCRVARAWRLRGGLRAAGPAAGNVRRWVDDEVAMGVRPARACCLCLSPMQRVLWLAARVRGARVRRGFAGGEVGGMESGVCSGREEAEWSRIRAHRLVRNSECTSWVFDSEINL